MKITLKLYATLSEYLPEGAVDNAIELDVPGDVTLNWMVDHYRVPRKLTHLVLVNGVFSPQRDRDAPNLKEGDTVAIWPPIAGG
jgi:molybdopterin synthase sulfur carrier subunit